MARRRASSCARCCSWRNAACIGFCFAVYALVTEHRGHMQQIDLEQNQPLIPVVPAGSKFDGPGRQLEQLAQDKLPAAGKVATTATITSSRTTIPAALPQAPNTPETTWQCVGEKHNRSCYFRNLYYGKVRDKPDENFMMFLQSDKQLSDIDVFRADKYEGLWEPDVIRFESVTDMETHLSSKVLVEKHGLSLQFNPLFPHNIGHAMFDGLYPAYVALTKFGMQSRPFRPVAAVAEDCVDDKVPGSEFGLGDLVEAYLPHPDYGKTLFPERARILWLPSADEIAKTLCDYKADLDHSGVDLGAQNVGPDGETRCCMACARTRGCVVGVLFGGLCYLKGMCNDGGSTSCFEEKPARRACSIAHSGESDKDDSSKVALEPISPPHAGREVRVPLPWVLGRVRKRCMAEEIYETFGRTKEMLRLFEMARDCKANPDLFFRFEEIVLGIGGAGNMVADESGAIGGSLAPYHAMASFRDRMLLAYGLPVHVAPISRKTEPLPEGSLVQVIVIANKRFTKDDQAALKHAIEKANEGRTIKATYIDWGQITGPSGKFSEHLQRVQQAHIYVSSIGTALQYVPFLRDGCVYIALGSVWGREKRQFPTFMEQQLAGGGTPYLRTLYADPGAVLRKGLPHPAYQDDGFFAAVDGPLVYDLILQAEKIARQGFRIPVPPDENLSQEGRLMLELCREDPVSCREMQHHRNGGIWECALLLWNECVVYEIGPWGDGKCSLNRELLRKLRKKYGLPSYGVDETLSPSRTPSPQTVSADEVEKGNIASAATAGELPEVPSEGEEVVKPWASGAPAPPVDPETRWETTWECVGTKHNRSCLFRNLYFGKDGPDDQFIMFVSSSKHTSNLEMKRANKYEGFWIPRIRRFGTVKEIKNFVGTKLLTEVPGLSLQFNPLFAQNIGHAIFDGLYPAYLALVKFGLQDRPFRPIAGVLDDCFEDGRGLHGAAYQVGDIVETYLPDPKLDRTIWPKKARVIRKPEKKAKVERYCDFVKDMDDSGLDMGAQRVGSGKHGEKECARLCARTRQCKSAVLFAEVCYLKGPCSKGPLQCNYEKKGPYTCNLDGLVPLPKVRVRPEGSKQTVEVPEHWVLGRVRARCMSETIYKKFGGSGEQFLLFEIERDSKLNPDLLLRFEEIVFGVGGAGNMVADVSGAIAGSLAPYNAMASFRDRMLRSYGLPVPRFGLHPLASDEKLHIIVISNKRFSGDDRTKLLRIIQKANEDSKVKAEFIDWSKITSPEGKFREHLRYVQRAHVYVSSIGTALQYVPFLRDGCAYIALGSVWGREGRQFPTFMEQQLAGGGTPYVRTLYADPGKVLRENLPHPRYSNDGYFAAVDEATVLDLFTQAQAIVRKGFKIPVPAYENLSQEARVLLELCEADPKTCKAMQDHRNGVVYECALLLWNEPVVYEVGPWGDGRCAVNRKLLRELRLKHGLPSYGAKE